MALHLLAGVLEERGKPLAARFARHVASDPVEASRQHSVLSLQDYSREQMRQLKKGPVYALTPGLTAAGHHVNLAVQVGDHVHSLGGFFAPEHAAALLGGFAREGAVPQDGHTLGGRAMRLAEAGRDLDPPPLKDYQPEAPEQDWRPNEMLPEDYHSYGRKRKYARYSEVASHPEVLGLMAAGFGRGGELPHGVFADRVEELGFPAIADHIRRSARYAPHSQGWEEPLSERFTPGARLLMAGQPVLSWHPDTPPRRPNATIYLPSARGKVRKWSLVGVPRDRLAAHLRRLAAEGVAISRWDRGGRRPVNTDESAARRLARLRYAAPAWWPRTGWGGRPGKGPITHEKVNAWLGKKDEKQLSRNRKVWRDHTGDIHLRLHYTNIVTWHPDGSYTLNTGGWHSPTTARNMAAVIGLPVQRVNKRGQPPQLGVQGKPIVDGAKWEPVMPPAPEQDYRPDSMLPEDYHSLSRRKRKYARFSEFARSPELQAMLRSIVDGERSDPVAHGALADWIEERGFPAIAQHIRESGLTKSGRHRFDVRTPWTPEAERVSGQPDVVVGTNPWNSRTRTLTLGLPYFGGRRPAKVVWFGPDLTTSQVAGRLRAIAGEGAAVRDRRFDARPGSGGRARYINTDESAAKRSRRKYAQKKPRTADFLTAVRVLRGSGQKRLHAVAEDIARGLGLAPAKTRDALLDGPRGALPGVAQAVAGADPHTARYAAAWYGLLARTPSLGLFHVRPDGPDSLYKFHVRGSAHTARRVLDRHGIAARVLFPHGAGYDVVVPDPGRRMRANALKAAGHLGGRVEESVGHLEPLGHADPAQARSAFRKIVERYEGGQR